MQFNWKDKEAELKEQIERNVKQHNTFINSDFGQILANGEENYGNDWTAVFWWNGKNIEVYNCGTLNDYKDSPQHLIDYYHFSKARTKVIIRHTGEDVTEQILFNPLYRDIFNDERLKK